MKKTFLLLLLPALALIIRLIGADIAYVSFLVLAVYALFGHRQAILALLFSWVLNMLSLEVAPDLSFNTVGRHLVIVASALSVFMRSLFSQQTKKQSMLITGTMLFAAFLVLHSLLFSTVALVSLFKVLSFTLAVTTLMVAWSGISDKSRKQTENIVFGVMIIIMLSSISLLLSGSGLGYLRNGYGFQGVLNQPQVFGVMVSFLGAWVAGRFFVEHKHSLVNIVFLGICLFLIYMSGSRIAGAGLVLSFPVSLILLWWFGQRSTLYKVRHTSGNRVIWIALIAITVVIFSGPSLFNAVEKYVTKGSKTSNLWVAIKDSRGRLVGEMFDNIEKNPIKGIGFGVASDPSQMNIKRDPVFNLPVSAPVEKGVMPVATLEELGIPGFVISLAWFWMLTKRSIRNGFVSLTVFTTALLTNLGEATFFSPGGMGLLVLIVVVWSVTSSRKPISVISPTS